MTRGRSSPNAATIGSSAFSTAVTPSGPWVSARRMWAAVVSSSPYRSSWSRKRLVTTIAPGAIS